MIKTNGALVAQVRQAIDAARQAGQPAPGRPTLVKLTGATDHAVRRALADLAAKHVNAGEPDTDETEEPDRQEPDHRATAVDPGITRSPAADPTADTDHQPSTTLPVPVAPGGRFVAWAGFIFGSVMSIAANVLHAWLPAAHEPAGWSPGIPPQVGAAVWQIGLMLAVEALSRIHWPKGLGWGLARFGGAGAVALGSAIISYGHLRDVLLAWQYGPLAADVGPLVLDGLMVVCGFALLANSLSNAREPGGDHRHQAAPSPQQSPRI